MTDYDEDDTRAFADFSGFGGCLLWIFLASSFALIVGVLIAFNS